MDFKMEDGKFVIDETNYNRFSYKNTLALPIEYEALFKEIKECEEKIKKNSDKIRKYVTDEFTPKGLPATFKCISVDIKSHGVVGEWQSDVMKVERIKRDKPIPQEPEKEKCIYQKLSQRYDFKQILNSGVLSKEEKRKCLGLPTSEGDRT